MDIDPKDLVKISITQLIKFADSFAGIEVHLPVNQKFIKLNYADEQFIDILRKLQQKDVHEIYVQATDCKRILTQIQDSLSPKSFYDPKTIPEDKIETLESSLAIVKSVIGQLGVTEENVKLLKTINTRSMAMLNESPSIFAFVKRFKKNCSEEYMKCVLTTFVMSLIIDKFPWKSDMVKEKGALASLLCDMVLLKDDFELIKEWEKNGGTELPDRIRSHPAEVAENLRVKRNIIPPETITIVEQHHELPDGKGFPFGITANRFNQLSCIFIVSQRFIEELFEADFDFEKRFEIIKKLQTKYASKSFDKALDALVGVVDV